MMEAAQEREEAQSGQPGATPPGQGPTSLTHFLFPWRKSGLRRINAEQVPNAPGRWRLAILGLILLHLASSCERQWGWAFLLSPAAGLAVILAVWLGPRAAFLVAADTLLIALQAYLLDGPRGPVGGWELVRWGLWSLLAALGAWGAWWGCQQARRGGRGLEDPRSATIFLLLVPGLISGLTALAGLLDDTAGTTVAPGRGWRSVAELWLGQSLGILTLAAPLLVTLTPWLLRRGIVLDCLVAGEQDEAADLSSGTGARRRPMIRWAEGVELVVLALAAATLGVLLAWATDPRELGGWRLWGVPLLLIVWAALRQGLRGGTVVAAAASLAAAIAYPSAVARATPIVEGLWPAAVLQANLLAQCGTALLVAAAAHWVRQSEARYRQVVGHIPVGLYTARVTRPAEPGRPPGADIVFVSPACCDLLGQDTWELQGDNARWLAHVHPDDMEIVVAALAQLGRAANAKAVTCEYRLASIADGRVKSADCSRKAAITQRQSAIPNGSRVIAHSAQPVKERWLRETLAPRFGAGGQLVGWDAVLTDITEQRELADDLRRTTSMFYALVANLPAGVFFVHSQSGRPILVNARARQLLGQREDPVADLGRFADLYRLHRPDGSPYPAEELPVATALRHGITTGCDDIVIHRPDGRRIPLVTWAAPVDLSGRGKADAVVWVFEDLTALRQAETATSAASVALDPKRESGLEPDRLRVQRLELIGRLAGGIAHDFNNLLTVMLSLAELARGEAPPGMPALDQHLQRITEAGEQAASLAGQLLAFSKQRQVTPRQVEVNQLTQRTLELVRAALPASIVFQMELADDAELHVLADETQLQQVLMNLCLNARDAMPDGGVLRVETSLETDMVRLSVHDTGQGMAEEVRARIFDPFFSTKEEGTGLGLAVVRRIVERYAGRVEVWSQPGQGSRFDVWLPLVKEEALTHAPVH
jgi:signal transduction histidine kinase